MRITSFIIGIIVLLIIPLGAQHAYEQWGLFMGYWFMASSIFLSVLGITGKLFGDS